MHIRRLRLALEPFGAGRADRDGARQRLPARGAALSATGARAMTPDRPRRARRAGRASASLARARLARRRRAAWALARAGGRRGGDRRASTSYHLDALDATGRRVRSTRRCPEGAARGAPRSPRSTGACARAPRTQRDLAHTIERFQQRRRGDSRRHGRARRAATASSGRTRARSAQLGLDLAHDVGAAARQPRAPARVPALPRGRRYQRRDRRRRRSATPASRCRCSSCRSASTRSC